jgi:hypothetical protein
MSLIKHKEFISYVDWVRLDKINLASAYFVIRSKNNLAFKRVYYRQVDKSTGKWINLPGYGVIKPSGSQAIMWQMTIRNTFAA